MDKGEIYKVRNVEQEQAAEIKKYGSNQGTFPAMNLAPLYRLTDETEKKIVSELLEGDSMEYNLEEIRQLCHDNNWGTKFRNKYHICMQEIPKEIEILIQKAGTVLTPFQQLIKEVCRKRVFDICSSVKEDIQVEMKKDKENDFWNNILN